MFEALLKGLTLGLLLSISVGPVIFSIIKQSLNNGHRGGIAFILGVSASDVALVLVSNVFTEMFGYMVKHKNFIGIAGSIFLISMGIFFEFFGIAGIIACYVPFVCKKVLIGIPHDRVLRYADI